MGGTIKLAYDMDVLLDTFNVKKERTCPILTDWMAASSTLDAFEQKILDDMHEEMITIGEYWNEEELKIRFVGHIFYIAKIDVTDKIRVFFERPLSATIGEYRLAVVCDCLVATPKGINAPRNPYFFLQEFKKGKGEKNDPEAQMLMAMLIAQQQNNDGKPIYGGYLIGKNWHFTTL
ncbi:MAG: hypothetical protein ACKVUS_00400, partial [Saprospiraceae bacterium]